MTRTTQYLTILGLISVVALAISLIANWPLGVVSLCLFIGWPIVGTLITIDDDFVDGWSNPDGKTIPEWKTLNWHVEILFCRGSLVLTAFSIQFREEVKLAMLFLVLAIIVGTIGFAKMLPLLKNESSRSSP